MIISQPSQEKDLPPHHSQKAPFNIHDASSTKSAAGMSILSIPSAIPIRSRVYADHHHSEPSASYYPSQHRHSELLAGVLDDFAA